MESHWFHGSSAKETSMAPTRGGPKPFEPLSKYALWAPMTFDIGKQARDHVVSPPQPKLDDE